MEIVELEEGEDEHEEEEVKILTAKQQKAVHWKEQKKEQARADRDELGRIRHTWGEEPDQRCS